MPARPRARRRWRGWRSAGGLAAGFLAGCGPDFPELRDQLASGEVRAPLPALATLEATGPTAPFVQRAATLTSTLPQLEALATAEGPMLRASVEQALAAGDVRQAAARLGVAAEAGLDDLDELSGAVEAAARSAEPTTRHQGLAALAELWESRSAAQAHRLHQDAVVAAIHARYTSAHVADVRASQAGITRSGVEGLLRRVDREYVVAVDWTAAVRGAATRLGALQQAPEAQQTWPGLRDVVFTGGVAPDLDAALAHLDAAARTGERAGLPIEVVHDEWVRGALGSLDPWTRAVWPAELAAWSAGHAGVHEGVGLVLVAGPDASVVVDHPLPGTPAWSSGVHQDDRVEAISDATGSIRIDQLPADRRLAFVQAALRGPADTEVRLEVRAPGANRPRTLHLIRGPVVTETVEGWARDPEDNRWQPLRADGVAYVRISRFKPTTEAAFDALLDPHLDDIEAVVLDLRGNPGGDVNSAVQIADRFVADGWLAELSGRVLPDTGPDVDPTTGAPLAEWNQAIPGHALEGVPVAVLVDDETASAAEVLAGALQERAGAVVVGRATWGKGLAQALRTAEDGSYGVQYTNVVWTLPSGRRLSRRLDGGGIEPDVALHLGPASRYQLGRDRADRSALRVHADGTPLRVEVPNARDDLPPLDADPAVLAAELVLLARRAQKPDTI